MWWISCVLLCSTLKSVSTQASSFIINIVHFSKLDQLYVLWITMAKSFIFFIPHSLKMAFEAVGTKSIVCASHLSIISVQNQSNSILLLKLLAFVQRIFEAGSWGVIILMPSLLVGWAFTCSRIMSHHEVRSLLPK